MCANRERSESGDDDLTDERRQQILDAFLAEHGDHYKPETALGSGRFGFTYQATDTRRHISVCLKFFKGGQAPRGTERDWNITSNLQRDDVINTFSVEHFGKLLPDGPWVAAVSRYVDGLNLAKVLKELPSMSPEVRGVTREALLRDIGIGLCVTMQALHNIGVVHGDLHSDNIIVRKPKPEHQGLQFVIIDFSAGSLAISQRQLQDAGSVPIEALASEMDVEQLQSIAESIIVGTKWSNDIFSVVRACRTAHDLRHGLELVISALGGLDNDDAEFFSEEHWINCLRQHLSKSLGGLSCVPELLHFYAAIADGLDVRTQLEAARQYLANKITNDLSYPKVTMTAEISDRAAEKAILALFKP